MALTIGSRLGHYQVDALIGEGGIGQVYQATDTRLNGQKILPHVAADPDLKQRFGGGGRSGADLVRVPQVMRLTPSILAVSVVVMVVACATLAAATDWEPVTFRGTRPTEYTYERLADGLALRADSKRTASGLVAELPEELDPTAISWRWRLKRFSNRPCTTWGGCGISARTDAGGPMRAYSMDLRERVLLDSDAGMKAADVAAKYRVSGSWVRLLKQRRRETGEVAPRVQRHGRRPMLEPHLHTLAALIAEQPDRTLVELQDGLGTPASLATSWRAVQALDITVKKNGAAVRARSA